MRLYRLPAWCWSGLVVCLSFSRTCLAQNRSTEAGEAVIKDPALECRSYSYSPVANHLSSFPPISQPALILPSDTAATNLWNSIAGSVPSDKIAVKGTLNGDFNHSMSTYPSGDPDCWWSYHHCVTPKLSTVPPDIYKVPEPRTLGYGFDDGPNCSHNIFYDYLQNQRQKATMFFIGSNVLNFPLEAQRAAVDGHEICVHTWSHHYMTAFPSPGAFAELYYSIKAIQLVANVTPRCWRPPYGDVDDRIRAIATGLGLRTVLWEYDSADWRGGINLPSTAVDANYQSLINEANAGQFNSSGTIMLTHELNNFTMSEAIKFYPQLRASFQHIVPVGAAMNMTFTYIGNDTYPGSLPVPGETTVIPGYPTTAAAAATTSTTTLISATPPIGHNTNSARKPHVIALTFLSLILSGIFLMI